MLTALSPERLLPELEAAYHAAGIPAHAIDFFQTPEWFANLAATCLGPGETAMVLRAPTTVLPLRVSRQRLGPASGFAAHGLSNFYSCRFAPPGFRPSAAQAGVYIGRLLRQAGHATQRFDGLDRPDCAALAAGLRRAGWITEPFAQFGNWHLTTAGLSFDDYWRARPGKLRNTGARRRRALFGGRYDAAVVRYDAAHDAEPAIAAFHHVAARSWQQREPFPAFLPGLIRYGLARREVEVWALTADGSPIAAQIWTHRHGNATIFKLAYDRQWRRLSAGTVLTMCALEALLDEGKTASIDFGWGDDDYKRDWLPERRQRYGLAAYNPTRPLGVIAAARNLGPKRVSRLRRLLPAWRPFGDKVKPI